MSFLNHVIIAYVYCALAALIFTQCLRKLCPKKWASVRDKMNENSNGIEFEAGMPFLILLPVLNLVVAVVFIVLLWDCLRDFLFRKE